MSLRMTFRVCDFLALEASAYINGYIIAVSRGWLAR